MTEIFEAYAAEHDKIVKDIVSNINELKSMKNGDASIKTAVKKVNDLLEEAEQSIKQMDIEVRSGGSSHRNILLEKVAEYKKQLSQSKFDFERAKEQCQRTALMGAASIEQRQKVLDVASRIDRQNEIIMNASRVVAETEEVGETLLEELSNNREKIESSQAKVESIQADMDIADQKIRKMQKNEKCSVM